MNRIILGTANFGNFYNGVQITHDGAFEMLDTARRVGIDWLETSHEYGNAVLYIGDYLKRHERDTFKVILKAKSFDDFFQAEENLGKRAEVLMWHGVNPIGPMRSISKRRQVTGLSVYLTHEYETWVRRGYEIVEFPFSAFDTAFANIERAPGVVHIARSIFMRGEIFQHWPNYEPRIMGKTTEELCWNVALWSKNVDYLCVGADNPRQVHRISEMKPFEVEYLKDKICALEPLVDPKPTVMLPSSVKKVG